MNAIAFAPRVDIPLALITVIAFWLNFNSWANNNNDTDVELTSRLPKARLRLVALFASLLLICWLLNVAAWAVLALFFVVSLVVAAASGNSLAPEMLILLSAGMIREWCFGFPILILQPPQESTATHAQSNAKFLGRCGTATSALRPSGRVQIDGEDISAVSSDGSYIELGANVVVTSTQNGQLNVRVVQSNEDSIER